MPEGDTVWLTARRLDRALAGSDLLAADLRVPRLATVDLSGRTVLGVLARGKHLLLRVSGRSGDGVPGGLTLHSHLRMDGAWRVLPVAGPLTGGPAWQIRVLLTTVAVRAVGFRLPVVDLLPTAREDHAIGHLGPDLLAPDWGPDLRTAAAARLVADPDRPIGVSMLDQRAVAGLGTVYRSEVLFLRGVSPWLPSGAVDPVGLLDAAHLLLRDGIVRGRQVTTGDGRPGSRFWVYDRAGRPCRRCGTVIRRAEMGQPGRQRPVFWCPRCQPNGG